MLLTAQSPSTDITIMFTVFSIILTGLVALAVSLIKSTLNDIRKVTISSATVLSKLESISEDITQVKDEMKDLSILKIDMAKIQVTIEGTKQNSQTLTIQLTEANTNIHKLKDELIHLYKEIKK